MSRTAWILQQLPAEGRLLDVGFAGEQSAAVHQALRRRVAYRSIFGVDLNEPRVLALALDKTVVADAFRLPFPEDTFSAVIMAEVLEHMPHPHQMLPELRRVLRAGGRLIVTTPSPYELSRWLRHWLFALEPSADRNVRGFLGNPDHKALLEPLSFCAELRRHGLQPVQVTTRKFRIPLVGRLLGRAATLEGGAFPMNRLGGYLCVHAIKERAGGR